MSRISSRPAAEQAARDLEEQFRPGTAVRHIRDTGRRGTVRVARAGKAVRVARMASGYEVEIHVVWEQTGPMWSNPDHLAADSA
ncbi:hypothetical protein [Actinomadura coerulea]|uniref:hypothetical protein n=1 Tax=Actinomadura coerulea TaxID=46159 RepID=UPI003442B306